VNPREFDPRLNHTFFCAIKIHVYRCYVIWSEKIESSTGCSLIKVSGQTPTSFQPNTFEPVHVTPSTISTSAVVGLQQDIQIKLKYIMSVTSGSLADPPSRLEFFRFVQAPKTVQTTVASRTRLLGLISVVTLVSIAVSSASDLDAVV